MIATAYPKLRVSAILAFGLLLTANAAPARGFGFEPTVLLYRIAVKGEFARIDEATNKMIFHVSGPVTVPLLDRTGLIRDRRTQSIGQFISDLSMDPFDFGNPPPVLPWSCGHCTLRLADGSEFQTYEPIQMDGRALFMLGPVLKSAASHRNPSVTTIRMAGCGGIQALAGPFAGQLGTLCANGIFSFDANDPSTMTGESHCSITLHTPAAGQ